MLFYCSTIYSHIETVSKTECLIWVHLLTGGKIIHFKECWLLVALLWIRPPLVIWQHLVSFYTISKGWSMQQKILYFLCTLSLESWVFSYELFSSAHHIVFLYDLCLGPWKVIFVFCVCVCVRAFFFFPMSWYFTGFMMPCTLIGFPGPFGEETGPQRYGFSTVHNRHEVLFHSLILCFMLNLPNVSMGWNVDKFHSNGIQWTVCHSFLESSHSWARDNIRCVLPELSREKELVFCLVV